ncbi:MAG: hypothetical protein ACOCVR_00660 [Myxococcota bacterium]
MPSHHIGPIARQTAAHAGDRQQGSAVSHLFSPRCPYYGVLLALLLLGAAHLEAQQGPLPRNLHLEEGKHQIDRGRYEAAVEELRRAHDLPGIPEEQRIEILAWMGSALFLTGDELEAERVWEQRIRAAPTAPFEAGVTEDVLDAFRRVKERTVIIRCSPPAAVLAGSPFVLEASLVDKRDHTADLLVYYRRSGEPGYQVAPMERMESRWVAQLLPPPLAGSAISYDLEYYLVAQSADGELLAGLGDAGEPMQVPVERAGAGGARDVRYAAATSPPADGEDDHVASGRRGRLWIFGSVLGACVLAAAGTTYVMVSSSRAEEIPATSLGTITFPLEER